MRMEEFYIQHEHRQHGPFDMMSMIRKIRNGQLQRDTMIIIMGEESSRRAADITEFYEIFEEVERSGDDGDEGRAVPTFAFMQLLKNGTEVLLGNLVTSVYTGMFLLLLSISLLVFHQVAGGMGLAVLGSITGTFLFFFYQLAILRKIRMQLLNGQFLSSSIKRSGLQLFIVALIIGMAVFGIPLLLAQLLGPLALALILLPGSLIMMFMFFAPILVADRGMKATEAMRASYASMRSLGRDNFITLYLVMLVNFIGAACLLIPLILTLPISVAALCEIYDDYFNEFAIA